MKEISKFASKEKLSKKAQKEINKKARKTWNVSPVTRKEINKMKYSRTSQKAQLRRDIDA